MEIIGDITEIKTLIILTIQIDGIQIIQIQIILQIIQIIIRKIIQIGTIEEDLTETTTIIITIVVETIDTITIIDRGT